MRLPVRAGFRGCLKSDRGYHLHETGAATLHAMDSFRRTALRFVILGVFLSMMVGIVVGLIAAASENSGAIHDGLVALLAALITLTVFFALLWRWMSQRMELVLRTTSDLTRVVAGELPAVEIGGISTKEVGNLVRRLVEIGRAVERNRRALEEQKREMTEILDALGEGLLAIDHSRCVLLANTRMHELFGVDPSIIGRPFVEVVRNTKVIDAFSRAVEGIETRERTSVSVHGSERQIEIRVFPLEQTTEIAAVALFIDVTQIQRLERIRRDFLADFSHEVRTPLTALRSAIETLESGRLPEEQEQHLRRIVTRQLDRMERLAQDLSELNSIESGALILHREPTSIRRLLAELGQDFFERAEGRGVDIRVDGNEASVDVDPVRAEQIFSNLIDNALKHAAGATELRLDVRDDGDHVTVSVSDDGAGIPAAECEKVFHRFYRVDKSRSEESGGTGIGLAITKHLVLLHGGSISVTSEAGQGTTFTVVLPKAARSLDEDDRMTAS